MERHGKPFRIILGSYFRLFNTYLERKEMGMVASCYYNYVHFSFISLMILKGNGTVLFYGR